MSRGRNSTASQQKQTGSLHQTMVKRFSMRGDTCEVLGAHGFCQVLVGYDLIATYHVWPLKQKGVNKHNMFQSQCTAIQTAIHIEMQYSASETLLSENYTYLFTYKHNVFVYMQ